MTFFYKSDISCKEKKIFSRIINSNRKRVIASTFGELIIAIIFIVHLTPYDESIQISFLILQNGINVRVNMKGINNKTFTAFTWI